MSHRSASPRLCPSAVGAVLEVAPDPVDSVLVYRAVAVVLGPGYGRSRPHLGVGAIDGEGRGQGALDWL